MDASMAGGEREERRGVVIVLKTGPEKTKTGNL